MKKTLLASLFVMMCAVANAATTSFTVNFRTNDPSAATWKLNYAHGTLGFTFSDVFATWNDTPDADGLYTGQIKVTDAYYTPYASKNVDVFVIPSDSNYFYSCTGDYTYDGDPIQSNKSGIFQSFDGVRVGSFQITSSATNQVKNFTVMLYPAVTTEYHKSINVVATADAEVATVEWTAGGTTLEFDQDGKASYTSAYSRTMVHDKQIAESGSLDFANTIAMLPYPQQVYDYTVKKGDVEVAKAEYVGDLARFDWNSEDDNDGDTYVVNVTASVAPERNDAVTLYTEGLDKELGLTYQIVRANNFPIVLDPADGYSTFAISEAENPVVMRFTHANQPENLYVYLNGNLIINGNPETPCQEIEWTGNLHDGDVLKVIYDPQAVAEDGSYASIEVPVQNEVTFTTEDMVIKPDIFCDYTMQITGYDLTDEYGNWADGLSQEVLNNTVFVIVPHHYIDETEGTDIYSNILRVEITRANAPAAAPAKVEEGEESDLVELTPDENGTVTFTVNYPVNVNVVGDNTTTGVENVAVAPAASTVTYNLQGIKVNADKLPAGIYIRGGQKFMVK